jgi:hypothetical protein
MNIAKIDTQNLLDLGVYDIKNHMARKDVII